MPSHPAVLGERIPITDLCPECGELIEVKDARAIIHALHLTNECSQMSGLFPQRGE
jgi:hypothetical protein